MIINEEDSINLLLIQYKKGLKMIKHSAAYLFSYFLLIAVLLITISDNLNKETIFSLFTPVRSIVISNDNPQYLNLNSFSSLEIKKQSISYIVSFSALLITSLSKLFKKTSNSPLSKSIKLNDNFPESNSKIFLTIPTPYDDGTNWSGRMNQATHPSVIQFEEKWNGYRYWMTYTPYPYGNDKKENPSLAASHDGINWVVPPKVTNPIVSTMIIPGYFFDTYLSDSHLLYNEDTNELELWYRYVSNRQKNEILYRVRSKDTIQWTTSEKLIDDSKNLMQYISPSIIYEEHKYKMWIMRDWYIYYLESFDGKKWSDSIPVYAENDPIHSWHPHVCKIGDIYYLLNNDNNTNTGAGGKIYYSTSSDGIYFTKEQLILGSTENGLSYDSTGVYRASMAIGNQGLYLYYGQVSSAYQWTIGLSIGPNLNNLVGIDEASLYLLQKEANENVN